MTRAYLLILGSILTGCVGYSEKRKIYRDIEYVVDNSIKNNEPCNITCGKLERVIRWYKARGR